jgi:hypothetical protein
VFLLDILSHRMSAVEIYRQVAAATADIVHSDFAKAFGFLSN